MRTSFSFPKTLGSPHKCNGAHARGLVYPSPAVRHLPPVAVQLRLQLEALEVHSALTSHHKDASSASSGAAPSLSAAIRIAPAAATLRESITAPPAACGMLTGRH